MSTKYNLTIKAIQFILPFVIIDLFAVAVKAELIQKVEQTNLNDILPRIDIDIKKDEAKQKYQSADRIDNQINFVPIDCNKLKTEVEFGEQAVQYTNCFIVE